MYRVGRLPLPLAICRASSHAASRSPCGRSTSFLSSSTTPSACSAHAENVISSNLPAVSGTFKSLLKTFSPGRPRLKRACPAQVPRRSARVRGGTTPVSEPCHSAHGAGVSSGAAVPTLPAYRVVPPCPLPWAAGALHALPARTSPLPSPHPRCTVQGSPARQWSPAPGPPRQSRQTSAYVFLETMYTRAPCPHLRARKARRPNSKRFLKRPVVMGRAARR
jgi:hypothetical protein